MMHGKLPAHTITAGLATFSEVRRERERKNKRGTKAGRVAGETKAREIREFVVE